MKLIPKSIIDLHKYYMNGHIWRLISYDKIKACQYFLAYFKVSMVLKVNSLRRLRM